MTGMLTCVSPIDGSVFAERPVLSSEEAFAAAKRAQAAQKSWAARSLPERIELVMAGVAAVGAMNDKIVPEIAKMMGRPVRYGGEFGGFNERASHMAAISEESLANVEVGEDASFKRYIKRIPHGVVFVVAPWNYPYMTAINTVAPALIAGNTVVLKHATQTLLVGERMAQAFHSAGVPEDVFQNVFLNHDVTNDLIAGNAFDFVNFTGSVGGGQAMERAAAGTFTGVGTELGGKDPGYVMEDADLDAAVDTLIDGAMFNSGQCCCGIERIYVHESLYDAFVAKAVDIVNGYKLGNPMEAETTIGPMANVRFANEVRAQISEALGAGATAHIAAFAEDDGGAYLTPQILTDVTHDMRVMRDESFGPVVGIMKVSSDFGGLSMSGFVSFVSSGPGDPELLTLKAVDRLQKAEAILFDDLSSGPILEHAGKDADLVGVGKRAGRPSPKQDHVSRLLVDYAKTGAKVVRLKSGDSGIFGRLEEEITALNEAGIDFEIIPGVTSASAAAAAAGIPLTRRLTARRVQFVTGHDVAGALPGDLHLQSLTDPGATTVLFMPKRTFPELAEKLFATGLRRDCPALLAENVSRPDQTLTRTTMEALAEQLGKEISKAPGIILFGELAESP